jgi:hypothetical protein
MLTLTRFGDYALSTLWAVVSGLALVLVTQYVHFTSQGMCFEWPAIPICIGALACQIRALASGPDRVVH